MDAHHATPDPASLLQHEAFLRALALRLVRDEATADDVVQEAWRAALTTSLRDPQALKAWLARVVRNAALQEWRSAGRRRSREKIVARPESVADAFDVVERAETHRRLVDAVLALNEPFRQVVLLRYFDGLTPKEISERLGIPSSTVRTRLQRGLDRLRAELDRRGGEGRRAWVFGLMPLARAGGGAVGMSFGKKLALVSAVALLVASAAFWVVPTLMRGGGPPHPETGIRAEDGEDAAGGAPVLVGRRADAGVTGAVPVRAPSSTRRLPWTLEGSVATDAGRPLAGAWVQARVRGLPGEHAVTRATTREDGTFLVDLAVLAEVGPLVRSPLRIELHGWADGFPGGPADRWSVALGTREDLHDLSPRLVLTEGASTRGRIVDATGRPVPFAMVQIGRQGSGSMTGAEAGADGRFVVPQDGPGTYRLRASAPGIGRADLEHVEVAAGRDEDVGDLELIGGGSIEGLARFLDGTGAPGVLVTAHVHRGRSSTGGLTSSQARTDEAGRFRLQGLMHGAWRVGARGTGKAPLEEPVFETGERDARVVLCRRRVRVFVEDESGAAVSGATYAVKWLRGSAGYEVEDAESGSTDVPSGTFSVWGVPGDRVHVSSHVEGALYAESLVTFEESSPWDQTRRLVLRPAPMGVGRLRVQLVDPSGETIPVFALSLRSSPAGQVLDGFHEARPGENGLFEDVPAGSWTAEVMAGRAEHGPPTELFLPIHGTVRVDASRETELCLEAEPAARLRITVHALAGEGQPVREVAFTLEPVAEPSERRPVGGFTTQREGGHWVLGGLRYGEPGIDARAYPGGRYLLRAVRSDEATLDAEVDLVAGGVTDVEVDMDAWRMRVQGGSDVPRDGPSPAHEGPSAKSQAFLSGTLQFDDASIQAVLRELAVRAKLELRVTPDAASVIESSRVTVLFEDLKIRTILAMILGPWELGWSIEGDTLRVGTMSEMRPAGPGR